MNKNGSRTSVLLSSIFFMADSVVRGNFTIWKASSFWLGGALHIHRSSTQYVLHTAGRAHICDCHRLRARADLTSWHHSFCHLTTRCTGNNGRHSTVRGRFLQRHKAHLILGYLGSLWWPRGESREKLYQSGGPPATYPARRLDPILFGPDPAAQADSLMNLGRMAEAEATYAEAIRVRPLNRSLWNARGRFYLLTSQPERAAANFAEAVRLWPDDFFLRQRLCLALLAAGDSAGLKNAVSGLLETFGNPSDSDEASRVASTCVLAPDAVVPEIPIRLAQAAVRDASAQNKGFPMATLGAALYRAGRFEDAIRSLEGGQGFQEAWPFLVMAHARLGHGDESRRWLDRLRNELAKPGSGPAAEDDVRKAEWSLWIYFVGLKIRLLQREAEAVVLYDPGFPDDPFAP